MIEAIGVILNTEKPQAVNLGQELYFWLGRKGKKIHFIKETADLLGLPDVGLSQKELVDACDFIVSLGGDGTLLYSARIAGSRETPILGVNLGNFGFLVAIEPKDIYDSLEKVLAGDFIHDRRMVLKSTVYRGGKATDVAYGLNDVVITKGGFSRMVKLATYVAGEYVNYFPADGIILSSPTGSTGYSLSAGGPIVSPKVDVIIMTPICPHTLYTRPLIISPEEQVRVILETVDSEVVLTVDGQCGYILEKGDEVVVERAPYRTTLVRFPGRTFYDVVRNKLNKGERNG